MEEEVITDLKQFIAATVSQATAHLATTEDLDRKSSEVTLDLSAIKSDVAELRLEVRMIADADSVDLEDHEGRIVKLEQQAA
jgi:hypothetical protein